MKLGETLIIRADLLRRLASLKERLERNAIVQEGDRPHEDPLALIQAIDLGLRDLEEMAVRINEANMKHRLLDGTTITAALARRDALVMKHAAYSVAVKKSQPAEGFLRRYSHSEIKWVSMVDGGEIQKQVDAIAKEIRELNARIQEANWQIEM